MDSRILGSKTGMTNVKAPSTVFSKRSASLSRHGRFVSIWYHRYPRTLTQMSVQALLPKNKYYIALGSVIDAALSRVLGDILALPDIPEVESHRLSELCKILSALEGLF